MIKIVPAIDLIGGENVRLTQGDYDQKSLMRRTPEEALAFYEQFEQVSRIHLVDLIGARDKDTPELETIAALRKLSHLPMEVGGGLRDEAAIRAYEAQGIDYFILGTRAIMDLPWLEAMCEQFPGKIFVGLDARVNQIYVNGWTQDAGMTVDEYLPQVEALDLAGIIYTDIEKDGMGSGPNFENTARIHHLTRHPVVASGGVRNVADLKRLESLGISEAIVGKACNTPEFWEGIV